MIIKAGIHTPADLFDCPPFKGLNPPSCLTPTHRLRNHRGISTRASSTWTRIVDVEDNLVVSMSVGCGRRRREETTWSAINGTAKIMGRRKHTWYTIPALLSLNPLP